MSLQRRCARRRRVAKLVRKSLLGLCLLVPQHSCVAEFDLDGDDLDGIALSQLQADGREVGGRSGRRREQTVPLLVGLLDASSIRRDLDNSSDEYYQPRIDLEELAAKQTAGGGLLDSIANMANSILGAGALLLVQFHDGA